MELDHMVAVTAFVSRRPALLTALGFGLRWGLGHSIAVLAAGAVLLATGFRWSPAMQPILEGAVGAALVAVGLWSLRAARNLHLHAPPEHGEGDHGITAVGLVHGLVGGCPGPRDTAPERRAWHRLSGVVRCRGHPGHERLRRGGRLRDAPGRHPVPPLGPASRLRRGGGEPRGRALVGGACAQPGLDSSYR